MTSSLYKEMLEALEEEGISVILSRYSWRAFGSWSIIADTEPERSIVWHGRKGQLSVCHTPSGSWTAYSEYCIHWEAPEGYTPHAQAVIDALLREDSPAKRAYQVRLAEAEVQEEKARLLAARKSQSKAHSAAQAPPILRDPALSDAEYLATQLLAKHMVELNYAENQLVKSRDFLGVATSLELRFHRYLLGSAVGMAAFWFGFGVSAKFLLLMMSVPMLGLVQQYSNARKTRIAIAECLATGEPALTGAGESAKPKLERRRVPESKQPLERKKPLEPKRPTARY